MSDIKDYIESKIKKNRLPLDLDEVLDTVYSLQKSNVYKNFSIKQIFYQYVLNIAGSIIANIDIDIAESFGYLKPKKSYNKDIIYYEFFTEEDYYNWLNARTEIYEKISCYDDFRILNFVEMCTIDFITDINTETKYQLYNTNLKLIDTFNKTKFGTDKNNGLSFIKHVVNEYYKNKVYRPI